MFLIALPFLALPALAPAVPDPVEVLTAWDRERAAAYLSGDAVALRKLYVANAPAARADLDVLADYRERGLTVWTRTQVFDVRPRETAPNRVVVRVTDRTLTVVGDGMVCRALPTTRPVQRVVTMVRRAGEWRVVSVRATRPGGPR